MLARKTERFRRKGIGAGGNSGATEPSSQRRRHTRMRRSQAGTSTRGAERAARASGCVATRRGARVGSGGFPAMPETGESAKTESQFQTAANIAELCDCTIESADQPEASGRTRGGGEPARDSGWSARTGPRHENTGTFSEGVLVSPGGKPNHFAWPLDLFLSISRCIC